MDAKRTVERAAEQVSSVAPSIAPKPAARSVGPGGGQPSAPAARSGLGALRSALRESAWFPVAAKAAAIFAGMLALAGIGAASTLAGSGVRVAVPSGPAPSVSGVWIAPDAPAASGAPSGSHGVDAAPTPVPAEPAAGPAAAASTGVTADGKVILNVANADELTKLPRVGAKRAQAILELRRRLGRFQRPTDLLRVRGIGRKTLKLMLPLLVVDAPSRDAPSR